MTDLSAATLGPGACDCHVHLFGPEDVFPFAVGRRYTPGDAMESDLDALHRRLDIDRVVLVQPSVYGTDNRRLLAGLERLGPRARAVAVIAADAATSSLSKLHRAGVRGVRVNATTDGVEDPDIVWAAIESNARRISAFGWHVQVLTRLQVIEAIADQIRELPIPLVIDHFGLLDPSAGTNQSGFGTLVDLVAAGKANVKLSAIERLTGRGNGAALSPFIQALVEANPTALIWGSDWPHTGGGHLPRTDGAKYEKFACLNDGDAVSVLLRSLEGRVSASQIFVANPARIYGFPTGASDAGRSADR